jgi:hypothetical protein
VYRDKCSFFATLLGTHKDVSVESDGTSLLQAGQSGNERLGIYALGNPYPTLQPLRWGEAEALTMAALGKRLGRPAASRVQWKGMRKWLLEALQGATWSMYPAMDVSRRAIFWAHGFYSRTKRR